MKSFFKKKDKDEKKPTSAEVKSVATAEPRAEEKIEHPSEMSWLELYKGFKKLSSSPSLKVKISELKRTWKPLIKELEVMIDVLKDKHLDLIEPNSAVSSSNNSIQNFLAIAKMMVNKAKLIDDELVSFGLYVVESEQEANKVIADNAIILYPTTSGYSALVITKKPHVHRGVSTNRHVITEVPTDLIKKIPLILPNRNPHREIILTEDNLKPVQKIIDKLAEKAGVVPNSKKMLRDALSLAEDIPTFLNAFSKLPFADILKERLSQIKTQGEGLDFNAIIKETLPIDTYKTLRAQVFEMLEPDEFKELAPEAQAAALVLIEAYNEAIKFVVLRMDKLEIAHGLEAGALTTKIGIVDGKSISQLCTEFNDVYQKAMDAAGFPIKAELYPYDFSILEQRKAMLKKIESDPNNNDNAQLKARIEHRNRMLKEVKPLEERENVMNLYHFMKKTVAKSAKRVNDLKAQFKSDEKKPEQEVKKDSINLVQAADSFLSKANAALKEALDEEIYQAYFTAETNVDKDSPWIQQAANAFHHIQKILDQLKVLQIPRSKEHETPSSYLEGTMSEADQILELSTKLITELNQLQKDPHLRKIISMQLTTTLEQAVGLSKQSQLAKIEAQSMLSEIKESGDPLREIITKLKVMIMTKAVGSMPVDKAFLAIDKASGLAHQLDALYKDMEGDLDRKPSMLMFAVSHMSDLIELMRSLPDLISMLGELPKEDFIKFIQQINNAFKQIVLLGDKLEIQLCLKNGYLTQRFAPLMKSYYDTINELGYDFVSQNDRYPFMDAILTQRSKLLEDAPEFQKKLIQNRIKPTEAKVFTDSQNPLPSNQEIIKGKMLNIISNYISKLTQIELKSPHVSKDRLNSIAMFKKLESMIKSRQSDQALNIDLLLKELNQNNSEHFYLLYEGKNASVIKSLEYVSALPKDVFKSFDIELARLKKQRGSWHLKGNKEKAEALEHEINACEKLKDLIGVYNINDALKMLTPSQEKILNKNFINHIRMIENALPVKDRRKTLIGVVKSTTEATKEKVDTKTEEHQSAVRIIEQRLQDLESDFSQSETVRIKIKLVQTLKDSLKNGSSLDVAIDDVYSSHYAKHAYLLFEGRTGKAIKSAKNMTITKDELINRLDADINALKKLRYSHLYVFANARKGKADHQIEVLKELKSIINDPSNIDKSVQQIIQELDSDKIKVLKHYEGDFLKDIAKITPQVSKSANVK